jgi:uncharacterized membrane protein
MAGFHKARLRLEKGAILMINSLPRVWQIDFFRGTAIYLMASFHFVFDLNYYWNYPVDYLNGFWYYVGKLSALLFTFIAGVSANLSARHVRRGLVVLSWGLVISVATYLLDSETYIRFGILHMQGSCMLLFPLVKSLRPAWLAAMGTAVFAAGKWTAQLTGPGFLLPLGIMPIGFQSLDYYPLLPWGALFLYGAALGKLTIASRTTPRTAQPQTWPSWARPFTAAGRHSLEIYLLHQPLLIGLLWVWHYFMD